MAFMQDWKKGPEPREGITDRELLARVVPHMQADGFAETTEDDEARTRFPELLAEFVDGYRKALSPRQRKWANEVLDRYEPRAENLVSRGLVPRGKPVETPAMLRRENLPMKPPGRK